MAKERVQKQKKKKWFNIVAPKLFNELSIGETPSFESESLKGKTVTTSLMNLTRDMKKQNVNVRLKIVEIRDNRALTELDFYEMIPSSIKRMVRRKKNRIDDSFVVLTKDKKKIRVKPMILTRLNTNQPVLSKIRLYTKAYLVSKISELTYGQFAEMIITDRLTRDMKRTLSKIYPVRICVMRAFKMELGEKVKVTALSPKEKALLEILKKEEKPKVEPKVENKSQAAEEKPENAGSEEKSKPKAVEKKEPDKKKDEKPKSK